MSAIEQNEQAKSAMIQNLAMISKRSSLSLHSSVYRRSLIVKTETGTEEEKVAEAGLAELWLTDDEEEGPHDDGEDQGAYSA